MSRLLPAFLWVLLVCGCTFTSAFAQGLTPAPAPAAIGVAIIASDASGGDEFAKAVEFVRQEPFGTSTTFTLRNGETLQVILPKIRKVFLYPPFASMTIVTEEDWKALQRQADEAAKLGKQYPKAAPYLNGIIASIHTAVQRSAQGMVVVAGRWLSKSEYDKLNSQSATSYIAELSVGGKTYKNVKASSVRDGQLRIMHDGGFATLAVSSLTDSQRTALAGTNAAIANDLRVTPPPPTGDQPQNSQPGMTTRTPGGPSFPTLSFSITGDIVVTQSLEGKREFTIDTIPDELLKQSDALNNAVTAARRVKASGKASLQIDFATRLLTIQANAEAKAREAEASAAKLEQQALEKRREIAKLWPEEKRKTIESQLGTRRLFRVVQKLQPHKFPGLEKLGADIYEVSFLDGELAILAAGKLRFEQPETAVSWVLPVDKTIVSKFDGFDKRVLIYHEAAPDIVAEGEAILKAENEVANLEKQATGQIENAERRRQNAKETIEALRYAHAILAPAVHTIDIEISLRLKSMEMQATLSDAHWNAVKQKLALHDYESVLALMDFPDPDIVTTTKVDECVRRLLRLPVNFVVRSEKVRVDGLSRVIFTANPSLYKPATLLAVTWPREMEISSELNSSRNYHLTMDATPIVDVHPDNNALIGKCAPLAREMIIVAERPGDEPSASSLVADFNLTLAIVSTEVATKMELGEMTHAQAVAKLNYTLKENLPKLLTTLREKH